MMNGPFSEDELIFHAANGDLDAFNQLVLMYQGLVYRHANAMMKNPDEADDCAQESFIKAFRNIKGFRGGSFRGWLLKIVTNTSYDRLRRMNWHSSIPLFPEDPDGDEVESPRWLRDPCASVEAQVQSKDEAHQIFQMLDELPAGYRNIIILIDVHELDYTEASEVLNIPLGTVKSRLTRARVKLIDKLQASSFPLPWQAECLSARCP